MMHKFEVRSCPRVIIGKIVLTKKKRKCFSESVGFIIMQVHASTLVYRKIELGIHFTIF